MRKPIRHDERVERPRPGRVLGFGITLLLLWLAAAVFEVLNAPSSVGATSRFVRGFLPPENLNSNAFSDMYSDFAPEIATDSRGVWLAVWQSHDPLGGAIDTDGDILVVRSTDEGASWTDPVPLNTNAGADTGGDLTPTIWALGDALWLAMWHSRDTLGGTVGPDFDVLMARSTDGGLTWSDPAPLNSSASIDSGPDGRASLAHDGGVIITVWLSDEDLEGKLGPDRDILFSRSTDIGLTWSPPLALNTNATTDSGADWLPHVVTDGAGVWLAVWSSDDALEGTIGDDFDILITRSTDAGLTWSDPKALNTNAAFDMGDDQELSLGLVGDGPKIATDRRGNWIAVWTSLDSLGGTVGGDHDVFVARSTDAGLTWSDPEALTERMKVDRVDGSSEDLVPRIQTDGSGLWIVAWESNDDLDGLLPPPVDLDLFVSFSRDNGVTWTDSAPLNTNAATDSGLDGHPVLATDSQGNWVVVWYSTEPEFGGGGGVLGEFDIVFSRAFFKNAVPAPVWKLYR